MSKKSWVYGVLGVQDYKEGGALRHYIDFVKENHDHLDGDIVESGVYQGRSLIGMAMMLRELGSDKIVYGFDSFSGFPPVLHKNDSFERFDEMRANGEITKEHYDDVALSWKMRSELSGSPVSSFSVSGSGDFSLTSKALVEKKIEILGLDNIVLVDGSFEETMVEGVGPDTIMCALMDCDLYQSYINTFNYVWPRLVRDGLIYLDEYYSLKFPGAHIATNEFVESHGDAELERFPSERGEFERWGMWKRS